MDNMSHMSFSEIRDMKIGLENWLDKLAGELKEINKELAERAVQGSVCRVGDDCDSHGDR